jgi:hypothetical protein
MARTALTVTGPAAAGLNLATALAAANLTDGNSFPWAARRYLRVVNGDDTALTVTVQTPGTVGTQALAVADLAVTVAASGDVLIGPLGPEYRQADGSVHVDYTGADASVTATVLGL